jgi:hypothetical protein
MYEKHAGQVPRRKRDKPGHTAAPYVLPGALCFCPVYAMVKKPVQKLIEGVPTRGFGTGSGSFSGFGPVGYQSGGTADFKAAFPNALFWESR